MSEVIVPDVRLEPWSTDATVIVDVASLAHWMMEVVTHRVRSAHGRTGAEGTPLQLTRADVARGLHRIVDVLEHHGVRTGRLLLGATLTEFPPESTGWRLRHGGPDQRARRQRDLAAGEALVRRIGGLLADRGIPVTGLPGMRGRSGEHCVDELCVLAAAQASWTEEQGRDVIVISRDADVAIAPLLAGAGRVLLARRMGQADVNALASRLERHGMDPNDAPLPPAHLRLLVTALLGMLRPADLPAGPLREALAALPEEEVPPVQLVDVDGQRVLRNAHNPAQRLSSPLDVDHDRTWSERRRPLLDAGVRATAIVDPFGLLATANRADVAGRIPTAASVARALAPLTLPQPLGQLAVIPDLLDSDHGLIRVSDRIGGVQLVPTMQDVITERVRAGLLEIDEAVESSLDSYAHDDLPETVGTPSQFARKALASIGASAPALEEKESASLLAADLLWALMHTDGPVVLVSDRPDLVALLDVMDDHFGEQLGMRGRVSRVGLQADPFTAEGIRVDRSGRVTRWPTALLTGRMIVDLLRIGDGTEGPDGGVPVAADGGGDQQPPSVTEAVAYDPVLNRFAVRDLDGRRVGEVGIEDVVQFPVDTVSLMALPDEESAARLRTLLATSLRLHLDLRVPLPSARLTREGGERLVGASILSARVIGHRDGGVVVRVTSSARTNEVLEVGHAGLAAVPASGTDVEIVVTDDGEHRHLLMPDLSDVPDAVGRPRPARIGADGRVELLDPLDPRDVRDDTGRKDVRARRLLGPYPTPAVGDIVLVTALDDGIMQVVSTPLPWVAADRP
jgi:hypothetical protein